MGNGYCATGKEAAVPLKALVVEDTDIIQKIHQLYLEELGFQVDTAETGYRALELAAQKNYGCILLDIGLPDFSGESVLSGIRYREEETGQHVPIIVNTAYGDVALLERCRKNGADAAFQKPITLEHIRKVLAAATGEESTTGGDGKHADSQ